MSSGIIGEMTTIGGIPFFVGPTSLADAELHAGDRLAARVLKMLSSGDVLLAFGQNRAVVSTSEPLQPGDRVELEVVTAGARPELRIVSDGTAASPPPAAGQPAATRVLEMLSRQDVLPETGRNGAAGNPLPAADRVVREFVADAVPAFQVVRDDTTASLPPDVGQALDVDVDVHADVPAVPLSPRDLPVIMRALADVLPSAVPIAEAGQEFLRAASAAGLRPAVTEHIQRMLAALDTTLPPAELAVMIRTFIAQSGLFTENHIRAALKSRTGAFPIDRQQIVTDVRLLLGELAAADAPMPGAARSFGEALLQQQLAAAQQQAATGVGHIAIPFMFGEERVDVVFEWEKPARREQHEDGPERTISLGVFVHLKVLGAIEARVEWQRESLAVTFFVQRESTRAIVEAALGDFSKQLAMSGGPVVSSLVRFNPDRPSIAPAPVTAAIPGGAIFDVMA